MSACCDIGAGDGLRSYFYNYYDEMATASCTALSATYNMRGYIAAIRRTCGRGPSCIDVCKNAKQLRGNDQIHMLENIIESSFDSFNCTSHIFLTNLIKFFAETELDQSCSRTNGSLSLSSTHSKVDYIFNLSTNLVFSAVYGPGG